MTDQTLDYAFLFLFLGFLCFYMLSKISQGQKATGLMGQSATHTFVRAFFSHSPVRSTAQMSNQMKREI